MCDHEHPFHLAEVKPCNWPKSKLAAELDPVGFVGDLTERAILDEVQRVPALFTP